tara:strand:- start:1135 stop:1953 length:819 start_codon:yes stop_codon:yes gene_type:complete
MSSLKNLSKIIVNLKAIRTFILFLLRRNMILNKFKNLIQLEGFINIYEHQIEILNDKKDAVSRDLCIFGIPETEKEIFKIFNSEIKNAASFLDIGAGIGLYTLFAISLNASASILAVEANPKVFEVLKKNLNNFAISKTNQKLINKIVSTKKSDVDFFVPMGDDFSYGTSQKILLEEKNIPYKKIIVETTDLSNFVENKYEIIKIDVEGSELDVLKAISNHLKYCRLLFIEIMIENKEASFNFLKNSNFKPLLESTANVGNYIFYNTDLQRH